MCIAPLVSARIAKSEQRISKPSGGFAKRVLLQPAMGDASELLAFLEPTVLPSAQLAALDFLLGCTATDEGLAFFSQEKRLIDAVCALVAQRNPEECGGSKKRASATSSAEATHFSIVEKAYACIVNISSFQNFACYILCKSRYVVRCAAYDVIYANGSFAKSACALLNNLCQNEDSASCLWKTFMCGFPTSMKENNQLQHSVENASGQALAAVLRKPVDSSKTSLIADKLLTAFCQRPNDSALDLLASMFCNLSMLRPVRDWFLAAAADCQPNGSLGSNRIRRICDVLPLVSLKDSPEKKRAAVGIIRNCTFDVEKHESLLSSTDVDLLPRLLVPLIVPGFDDNLDEDEMEKLPIDCQFISDMKFMEIDAEIRKMLLEALNQLCATRFGRTYLREHGCYYVLRELHKVEKIESVINACKSVVNILIQDEPEHDNLKDLEIPTDLIEQFENITTEALHKTEQ